MVPGTSTLCQFGRSVVVPLSELSLSLSSSLSTTDASLNVTRPEIEEGSDSDTQLDA